MLAKSTSKPFSGKDWIFELKWDGFRAIAYVDDFFTIQSRNAKELKHFFPELEELKQLSKNVVVDGEIVTTVYCVLPCPIGGQTVTKRYSP